eukprot:Rmarinus@m.11942
MGVMSRSPHSRSRRQSQRPSPPPSLPSRSPSPTHPHNHPVGGRSQSSHPLRPVLKAPSDPGCEGVTSEGHQETSNETGSSQSSDTGPKSGGRPVVRMEALPNPLSDQDQRVSGVG